MKAKISALMDGELGRQETDSAFEALHGDGDAREAWRNYHLIGDSMRETHMLSDSFAARVSERISQEPTVLAPRPARSRAANQPVWALSAAASLAAVALVGWLAFAPQDEASLAKAPSQGAPAKEMAQVAPPDTADDYLLAHQGYSPRINLQGLAPYVRTVSSEARGNRR